jgi:hypothetical protein
MRGHAIKGASDHVPLTFRRNHVSGDKQPPA